MRLFVLLLCALGVTAGKVQVQSTLEGGEIQETSRKQCGRGWCYRGGNTNLAAYFRSGRGGGTALTFRGLRENNLINGGRMIFSNIGRVGGTTIDVIITNPGGGYKRANRHYRWRRRSGYWFARRYNRAYRGCGMMGSLRAGTHQFRFTFVRAGTNQRVRIPFLPWTMYDLDGGKEYPSTRDAVGIMTYNPTGIRASCSGGVCRANAARREYPFPRNFDRLSRRSKMASVTFLFRNKASFLMSYRTTYPHRVFIFKGSLTAMKPRVRLPSRVGRGGRATPRRRRQQPRRKTAWGRTKRVGCRDYRQKLYYGWRNGRKRVWRRYYPRGHRRRRRGRYARKRVWRNTGRRTWTVIRRRWVLTSRARCRRNNRRRRARRNYRRRRNNYRRRNLRCSATVHRPACHGRGCRAPRSTIHRRRTRSCR